MRTLRGRLFAWTLLVVLASIGITLVVAVGLTRRAAEQAIFVGMARQVSAIAARTEAGEVQPSQFVALSNFFRRQGMSLTLLDRSALSLQDLPPEQVAVLRAGGTVQGETQSASGQEFLFTAKAGGDAVVVLRRPAQLGPGESEPVVGGLLVASLVGAVLAAAVSFFVAQAIAKPIGRVAEASRRLARGERPEPLPVEGSHEMATLSASFNEMAAQLAAARESERTFLLSVSHELKTPLTAIRGYSEALEEGAVSTDEAGRVIGEEASRLQRLVQDLLDLARLDRSAFDVRSEPVDLAAVARAAVQRDEPRAREFGVLLRAEATGPAMVRADRDRVLQAVSNLVENAIRSTSAGGSVTAMAEDRTLTVRDTGPGFAPEDLPRAFDRFFLHARYRSERNVGTGLGLFIVKELVEAMGGSVRVESRLGEGSAFSISLPSVEDDRAGPAGSGTEASPPGESAPASL